MVLLVGAMLLLTTGSALADKPVNFDDKGNETAWENNNAFDEWGYNYQGHVFSGGFCDYHPLYRPGGAGHEWCVANYGDVYLLMKWNDAWLSNQDRDGDGELDRHWGYPSYIGSGAWCTNHQKGTYINDGGKTCKWNWFVKIVAVPADATWTDANGNGKLDDGELWHTADGVEIGPSIWRQFAEIQSVYNDPCGGYGGVEYLSPANAGLGGW
jgi:hypothetical protein